MNYDSDATVGILTIIVQAIGVLALIPILSQQAVALGRYWKEETGSINSTRLMLVTWCVSLIWVGVWRIFTWWYLLTWGESFPWNEWGALSVSAVICLSAVTSLVAFQKRQRVIDTAIKQKLEQANLQHESRERPTEKIDEVVKPGPRTATHDRPN